jgi:hypothetical protein
MQAIDTASDVTSATTNPTTAAVTAWASCAIAA